jgi:hypothetical protein
LVKFMAIWYIFPVLVCCTKKNLATLLSSVGQRLVSKTRNFNNGQLDSDMWLFMLSGFTFCFVITFGQIRVSRPSISDPIFFLENGQNRLT